MIDLKNVRVDFPPNSAFAVLEDIAKICGIDSVESAIKEISAQQGVQLTGFPPNHSNSRFCECVVCMGMATVKPASN